MIQGLKFHIKGTELKELCAVPQKKHTELAKFYEDQIEKYKQAKEETFEEPYNNISNTSNVPNMQHQIKNHQGKAAKLEFIIQHVNPEETYELSFYELGELDVIEAPMGLSMLAKRERI
jgi:hypothetical protein